MIARILNKYKMEGEEDLKRRARNGSQVKTFIQFFFKIQSLKLWACTRQKRKVNFCVFCCFLSCSSLFLYYRQSTSTTFPLVLVYYSSQRKRVSLLLFCEQRYRAVSSCPNGRPYILLECTCGCVFSWMRIRTYHLFVFLCAYVCGRIDLFLFVSSYSCFFLSFFFIFRPFSILPLDLTQ